MHDFEFDINALVEILNEDANHISIKGGIDAINLKKPIDADQLQRLLSSEIGVWNENKLDKFSLFTYLLNKGNADVYFALLGHLSGDERIIPTLESQTRLRDLLYEVSSHPDSEKIFASLKELPFEVRRCLFNECMHQKRPLLKPLKIIGSNNSVNPENLGFLSTEQFTKIITQSFTPQEQDNLIDHLSFMKIVENHPWVNPYIIWNRLSELSKKECCTHIYPAPSLVGSLFGSLVRTLCNRRHRFSEPYNRIQFNVQRISDMNDSYNLLANELYKLLQTAIPTSRERCLKLSEYATFEGYFNEDVYITHMNGSMINEDTAGTFLETARTLDTDDQILFFYSGEKQFRAYKELAKVLKNVLPPSVAKRDYLMISLLCESHNNKTTNPQIASRLLALHTDLSALIERVEKKVDSNSVRTIKKEWEDSIHSCEKDLCGEWGDKYNILYNLLTLPFLVLFNISNAVTGKEMRFFQFDTEHRKIKQTLTEIENLIIDDEETSLNQKPNSSPST